MYVHCYRVSGIIIWLFFGQNCHPQLLDLHVSLVSSSISLKTNNFETRRVHVYAQFIPDVRFVFINVCWPHLLNKCVCLLHQDLHRYTSVWSSKMYPMHTSMGAIHILILYNNIHVNVMTYTYSLNYANIVIARFILILNILVEKWIHFGRYERSWWLKLSIQYVSQHCTCTCVLNITRELIWQAHIPGRSFWYDK